MLAMVAVALVLVLPRRLAAAPLMVGILLSPVSDSGEAWMLHFNVLRILVAAGWLRITIRGEKIPAHLNRLDWMLIGWAVCIAITGLLHKPVGQASVLRAGLLYDSLGLYFLLRVFLRDFEDLRPLAMSVVAATIAIAVAMLWESSTGRSLFYWGSETLQDSDVRVGHVRAQGPFLHAILAGTVGALCWPLILPFWRKAPLLGPIGIAAAVSMVFTSRSSGPIMTATFVTLALLLWKAKPYLSLFRWGALLAIVCLDLVMRAPVYYLVARVDFTGSSTGAFRADLIHSAIEHVDEWWVAGTDRTRHWMPSGVGWNPEHTDITNQYIKMGVLGGMPTLLQFAGVLLVGFSCVGTALRGSAGAPVQQQFLIWCLGAILFGHAMTFITVNYFDQSLAVFIMTIASIGSAADAVRRQQLRGCLNRDNPTANTRRDFLSTGANRTTCPLIVP